VVHRQRLTPYVAVFVDDSVQVPREYVQNGEIVLNVSTDATSGLKIGNEFIEFKARFGGVPREIMVPVDRVMAIYARENGQGMAFPLQARARRRGPARGEARGFRQHARRGRRRRSRRRRPTTTPSRPAPPRPIRASGRRSSASSRHRV
jgi:stringent starvation protein B